MSLLSGIKVNKAIAVLLESGDPKNPEVAAAIVKIKEAGRGAIPRLLDALLEVPGNLPIQNLLLLMLDNRSLDEFVDALADPDKRFVTSVANILARNTNYDPNNLLKALDDPDIPKKILLQILATKKERLNPKRVITLIDDNDVSKRNLAFNILNSIITEDYVPYLLPYCQNDDFNVRYACIRLIARFNLESVRNVLINALTDSNKHIRMAALDGISANSFGISAQIVCPMLKDPDFNIQAKAIEALIRLNDPETVNYLIDILNDNSEYIRRAAVEVLNEIADTRAIKNLLSAMRDTDWWVRVRAADALGSIGGPRVVEAVMGLLRDEDEFLRRTAVEILNSVKDERAYFYLIQAINDQDWWVRERAIDALGNYGDLRAIPELLKILDAHPESASVVVQNLVKLGGENVVPQLMAKANDSTGEVRKELLLAISEHTNHRSVEENNSDNIESARTRIMNSTLSTTVNPTSSPEHTTVFNQALPKVVQSAPPVQKTESVPDVIDLTKSNKEQHIAQIFDASKFTPGFMIADRYRVVKHIGKGAFGIVVLVHDTMVNEDIILKFLNAHMSSDENIIKRFVHELRFARKVTHENIIRIFDFITFGNSYAISMEYFPSHSLAYEMKVTKNMRTERVLRIFLDICKGVGYAHQLNIVHRDLKPANILIGENDQVKIVDFGLAAAASSADSRITRTGILVGTPTYMAPEQVRARAIDQRTDIYSLGVLMYEIFVGKPPYKGEDHLATLFQHVEGNATPPHQANPDIPVDISNIIMKAMATNPDQRYQTIQEFAVDIDASLKKEIA